MKDVNMKLEDKSALYLGLLNSMSTMVNRQDIAKVAAKLKSTDLGIMSEAAQVAILAALQGTLSKTEIEKIKATMKEKSDEALPLAILGLLQTYAKDAETKASLKKLETNLEPIKDHDERIQGILETALLTFIEGQRGNDVLKAKIASLEKGAVSINAVIANVVTKEEMANLEQKSGEALPLAILGLLQTHTKDAETQKKLQAHADEIESLKTHDDRINSTLQTALLTFIEGQRGKQKLIELFQSSDDKANSALLTSLAAVIQGISQDANSKKSIQSIESIKAALSDKIDEKSYETIMLALLSNINNEQRIVQVEKLHSSMKGMVTSIQDALNGSARGGGDAPLVAPVAQPRSEPRPIAPPMPVASVPSVAPAPAARVPSGFRAQIDQLKKDAQGVSDALNSIKGRFEVISKSIDVKTAIENFKSAKSGIAPVAPTTPAQPAGQERRQGNTKDIKDPLVKEEARIISGMETFLNTEGKAFVDEATKTIDDKKRILVDIQAKLEEIYTATGEDRILKSVKGALKDAMDGDYKLDQPGILGRMDDLKNKILNIFSSAIAVIKPIANGIREIKTANTKKKENSGSDKNGINSQLLKALGQRRGGGMSDDDQTVITAIDNLQKDIKQKVLIDAVLKFDDVIKRRDNPAMGTGAAAAAENVSPSIFARLFNNYLDERDQNSKDDDFKAAINLSESLDANNMVPREVLRISTLDKVVFIFVTLFIRLVALAIAELIINKGYIRRITGALAVFVGFYILLFTIFVLLVNFDMYRMRIVFNYVNFHVNRSYVFSHVIMLLLFSMLIFFIMWNVNFPVQGMKDIAISEDEKIELIYRMEVLTMIVWIFLVIMTAVL